MTEQDLYLWFKAEEGLKIRGKHAVPGYLERVEEEIKVISSMGFSSYMLVVYDYIAWAKRQGISVGLGRGSAAGSLVAYVLGITDVDPIKWGLMLERFLNVGRVSLPDVDTDFEPRRRQEVINYVISKYGADRVALISTIGLMKAKLAVRDVARCLGHDPETIDRFGKLVPDAERGGQAGHEVTLAKCLTPDENFLNEYRNQLGPFKTAYDQDRGFHEVVNRAVEIEGIPKSSGVHPAGIVIWDKPLTTVVPLMRTKEGLPATQWGMKPVESIGLVK